MNFNWNSFLNDRTKVYKLDRVSSCSVNEKAKYEKNRCLNFFKYLVKVNMAVCLLVLCFKSTFIIL